MRPRVANNRGAHRWERESACARTRHPVKCLVPAQGAGARYERSERRDSARRSRAERIHQGCDPTDIVLKQVIRPASKTRKTGAV